MANPASFNRNPAAAPRWIEVVPSGPRIPHNPQPSVTPNGGFASGTLPGSGSAAVFYTAARAAQLAGNILLDGTGVNTPMAQLEQQMRLFNEEAARIQLNRNERECDDATRAFQRQHGTQVPDFLTVTPQDNVNARWDAYVDLSRQMAMHQPQLPPSHQGNANSHFNPDNFNRLA